MEEPDFGIFIQLFRDAYARCFKQQMETSLTETESKLFYQQILEQTGLSIGWRSLKNYSSFIIQPQNRKDENPAIATLDTFARYVLNAPYTNDISRKNDEDHHPYWFLYKKQYLEKKPESFGKKRRWLNATIAVTAVIICVGIYKWQNGTQYVSVIEDFKNLNETGLYNRGWQVLEKDAAYWAKRQTDTGALTLYTLPGDNWPDNAAKPQIKNLLLHEMPSGCMTIELQMTEFAPLAEWQQAGLLLMQDTSLNGPSIRVSLAFNDLFGGYRKPREIIVQAISSAGQSSKPEEFAHVPVVTFDSSMQQQTLLNNVKYSSIRIEKVNNHYRFLYAGGNVDNSAFKEVAVKDLSFEPHYVAIFALKGWVAGSPIVRAKIRKFLLQTVLCN